MHTHTELPSETASTLVSTIYQAKISEYVSIVASDSKLTTTVFDVLSKIRDGFYQSDVEEVREVFKNGNAAAYRMAKQGLRGVAFSGVFSPKRKNGYFRQWSGFLLVDIDHCGGVSHVAESLRNDPVTAFFFVSPSGDGIKLAVHVEHIANDAEYKYAWASVQRWAKEEHNLTIDPARKDISGLCFVSYDPDLYINPAPEPFDVEHWKPLPAEKPTPTPEKSLPRPASSLALKDSWSEKTTERKIASLRRIIEEAPNGERHNARIKAARLGGGLIAGGWVSETDVWSILESASDKIADGGITNEGERKTLRDGIEYGKRTPIYKEQEYEDFLTWLAANSQKPRVSSVRRVEHPENPHEQYINTETGEALSITDADVWDALKKDDAGLSELLQKLFPDRVYDHQSKEWLMYEMGVWLPDITNSTTMIIKTSLQSIFTQYAHAQRAKKTAHDGEPEQNVSEERAKKADAVSKKLNKIRNLKPIEEFFRIYNAVRSDEFDTSVTLFNCLNGVLDLKAGAFLPHSSEHKIKKQAICVYNPGADCPEWKAFLNQIFASDQDLIRYIQQRLGLCLSGERIEQDIMFWYGSGANGKSVLLAVIRAMFGSYFTTFSVETILAYNHTNVKEYHLVRLQGARIAATSEIPQGATLNVTAVKDMTGGDSIVARKPAGQPFEFTPTHQPIMVGNTKPRVNAQDEGTWRRLRIIPFVVTIPESDRIPLPALLQKFAQETSGILNWLLEGYNQVKDFHRMGKQIPVPEAVSRESNEYRIENDALSDFLSETFEITRNPNHSVKLNTIFKLYSEWCAENSIYQTLRRSSQMSEELQRKGFTKRAGSQGYATIHGFQVKDEKPF